MSLYYSKQRLYLEIERLKRHLGVNLSHYPIDAIKLCDKVGGVTVQALNFSTNGLQGILYMAQSNEEQDVILLNAKQTPTEQNFYCMHELIHSALHRNEGLNTFNCFDSIRQQQDVFLEWHANEGAAEFLVPYRDFIPAFCDELAYLQRYPTESCFIRYNLAERYNVTSRVIRNRIETLRYEIDQYRQGVPIEKIDILSKTKQEIEGICSTDYNVICDNAFDVGISINF